MERRLDFEIRHLKRALGEIIPYSIKNKTPILKWEYFDKKIEIPFRWNETKVPAVFESKILLNQKNPTYLSGWFGGESLIKIDEKPYGEINVYHTMIDLTPFCDGKFHNLKIETMPRGLFGKKEEPIFKEAYLIEIDKEIKSVITFTNNVIQLCEETKNKPLVKRLVDLTNDFLYSLNIPHSTSIFISKVKENPTIEYDLTTTWSTLDFSTSYEFFLALKKDIIKKFSHYKKEVEKLTKVFPKIGQVYLVGHAHIDYAWLWPVYETKRKIIRTFSNAVQLAKKYPYFIFAQSSAQMYEDIEKDAPEIFEEIKNLVKSGQWEPVGGMWIESDCNIPGIESLIRQFYYGQKYFIRKFGKKSRVCWLPDVFGFSWILPQILKEADIDYFITTKLNWNETNEYPYDICIWKGIDGSEVLYHSFNNDEGGYGGNITPKTVYSTWNNFKQKDLSSFTMVSVGYGDGGGGPTEEMCESYPVLQKLPDVPKVEFSKIEDFCKNLQKEISDKNVPVWDNELYLELHRGTLTSQAKIKKLHKQNELLLFEAEVLNALFDLNKQNQIDKLWKKILALEFHDIITGSSIKEVYEDAEKVLNKVTYLLNEIINSVPLYEKEKYLTLFNPASFKQKIKFILPEHLNLKFNGRQLDCIKTYDNKYLYTFNEYINPLSLITLEAEENVDYSPFFSHSDNEIENKYIKMKINEDGTFNIYHKTTNKWLFKDKGNILMLYKDIPYFWENWDIDVHHTKSGIQLKANSIEVVETNTLRKVIKVKYKYEETKITQYYIIWNDSDIVDIKTNIDFHHRRCVLKAIFPTNILSRYAKFDLDGGYITRATHQNTNFEKARFEVPGHRWVNLSQYDFGISILNNGKYGHSVINSTIGLTLVKAGIYPDFFADEGKHEFSYAIMPNEKEDILKVIKEAELYNKSIRVLRGKPKVQIPTIKISKDNFKILSFRKIKGSFVLRIVETTGSSGDVEISINNMNLNKAFLTNNLEEIKKELKIKDNSIQIKFKPFKIYTFLFE